MLNVLISIGVTILLIGFILVLMYLSQYIVWFQCRICKHCNHTMQYRGLKENEHESHYLFQCPHCGAWEKVPKRKFQDDCDKDLNPNSHDDE